MFLIEWLTSGNGHPIEPLSYPGILQAASLAHAKAAFIRIKEEHPSVIGFRILDETHREITRWEEGA